MNETLQLSLVPDNSTVLRSKAVAVADIQTEVRPHIDAMRTLMERARGVGLAAPQVGIGLRFFITSLRGLKVVINPRIVLVRDSGRTSKPEGCLTWPGRQTYVCRHDKIIAEWTDLNGAQVIKALDDWDARVFQHENDHLNGICIFP